MVRAIICTHQTIGACAGVCACDRIHQTEKSDRIALSAVLIDLWTENHSKRSTLL